MMLIDRDSVAAALPAIEVGGRLGSGAFGLVLSGRHRRLNRDVAVKVLAAAPEDRSRFEAEAQLLAGLDHPHIVRVYDYVEADDLCLIVMEMLAGGTLTRRARGIGPEAACAVGLGVASALGYAHGRGVLHRDIKLDNVMFDAASTVKVTDFGIAKIFHGSATTATGQLGTPMYMAPEQILGGRIGPATDIYALGVLLYRLLVGRPPFDPGLPLQALWRQVLDAPPPTPVGVPGPVAAVLLRALAKEPADRQPSGVAFALDLAAAAAASYGSGWLTRGGVPLLVSDEIRDAATGPRTPPPAASRADDARPERGVDTGPLPVLPGPRPVEPDSLPRPVAAGDPRARASQGGRATDGGASRRAAAAAALPPPPTFPPLAAGAAAPTPTPTSDRRSAAPGPAGDGHSGGQAGRIGHSPDGAPSLDPRGRSGGAPETVITGSTRAVDTQAVTQFAGAGLAGPAGAGARSVGTPAPTRPASEPGASGFPWKTWLAANAVGLGFAYLLSAAAVSYSLKFHYYGQSFRFESPVLAALFVGGVVFALLRRAMLGRYADVSGRWIWPTLAVGIGQAAATLPWLRTSNEPLVDSFLLILGIAPAGVLGVLAGPRAGRRPVRLLAGVGGWLLAWLVAALTTCLVYSQVHDDFWFASLSKVFWSVFLLGVPAAVVAGCVGGALEALTLRRGRGSVD
ncbi:hypothetical protein BCD49_35925 [Pseudofrankia sp. EUN1h]|nr:hypothetical protein BCD49_35925 [Pseudofrankia sp. EUN1h]